MASKKRLPGQKSTVKRREDIPRPYNGGEWTAARMTSFIKSALRGARWPQKYVCIEKAFVEHGINPKTGRKCKLHLCPDCRGLFPATGMQADHIVPVVGPEGFVSWDLFISRLYTEASGFRAICRDCHKAKTKEEGAERRAAKKADYQHPIDPNAEPPERRTFAPSL